MNAATAERVTIRVTQEHIDHGEPGNCEECAMALAFLAAIPGAQRVAVRYYDRHVDDDREPEVHVTVDFADFATGSRYYRIPQEVAGFVSRFDDGLPVEPFTFEAEEVTR